MYLEVRGCRWYCEDAGKGLPVLLLHGFPLSSEIWSPLRDVLASRCRVVTPDLRGFGRSDKPEGPYTMESLAEDVLGLADTLGLDRFVLGGHSMGGYVAFRVAARAPGRLVGLILVCTRAEPDTEEGKARRRQAIETIRAEGSRSFLEAFLPNLLGATAKASRPELLERLREIASAIPAHVLVGCLVGMRDRPDSRDLLPRIQVPALVVAGEEDPVTPLESARRMAEGFPRAQLVLLPRCGHTPSLEAPEALARALLQFLGGLEG
ncbi:MAG: alpha/beta hydrolase [Armatimonadota bacterium]|nr:alpha/beta hydrolase [Armatimonadota bacterium]MDR7438467.1 alpha/beta hydrolase [Armatimonadota bacterium]MDR7563164.1 alpha/beta hydrolase [Armatimonadota bacterium]MDR7567155.1 alpha/beta hydrolase [Armatimonadota bacterium]MDR7602307.1 alpha/beta hydrolase [Armatimonadota bacterium]